MVVPTTLFETTPIVVPAALFDAMTKVDSFTFAFYFEDAGFEDTDFGVLK